MKNNWLTHLIHHIVGEPSPLPAPPRPSLTETLTTYQHSLDELTAAAGYGQPFYQAGAGTDPMAAQAHPPTAFPAPG